MSRKGREAVNDSGSLGLYVFLAFVVLIVVVAVSYYVYRAAAAKAAKAKEDKARAAAAKAATAKEDEARAAAVEAAEKAVAMVKHYKKETRPKGGVVDLQKQLKARILDDAMQQKAIWEKQKETETGNKPAFEQVDEYYHKCGRKEFDKYREVFDDLAAYFPKYKYVLPDTYDELFPVHLRPVPGGAE